MACSEDGVDLDGGVAARVDGGRVSKRDRLADAATIDWVLLPRRRLDAKIGHFRLLNKKLGR